MPRGGKRPGAGRRRESIQTAIRLPIPDVAAADLAAAREGCTRSDVIRRWVSEGADREREPSDG